MANRDAPMGFRPAYTLHGGPPHIGSYKNTAVAIYPGDAVHLDGSGRVNSIASTETPMGVAATYVSATAGQEVLVYDDLTNTIFEVQADEADIADDTTIGLFYDVLATTGNTTTLQSKQELDSDASAEDTLINYGKVDRPDNTYGANVNLYVKFRTDELTAVLANT